MASFVQVVKDEYNRDVCIPTELTAVVINKNRFGNTLTCHNQQGLVVQEKFIGDAQKAMEAVLPELAKQGTQLLSFQHSDGQYYISPAAVAYIHVRALCKDGPRQGTHYVDIGVKGAGELICSGVQPHESEALVQAVQSQNQLLKYTSDQVYISGHSPERAGSLYINPLAIKRMTFNRNRSTEVTFADYVGSLCVQQAPIVKIEGFMEAFKKAKDFNFAAQVAAHNPSLVSICASERTLYICPDQIASLKLRQPDPKTGQPCFEIYPMGAYINGSLIETIYCEFKTEAERQQALHTLGFLETAPLSPASQPKPTPPPIAPKG